MSQSQRDIYLLLSFHKLLLLLCLPFICAKREAKIDRVTEVFLGLLFIIIMKGPTASCCRAGLRRHRLPQKLRLEIRSASHSPALGTAKGHSKMIEIGYLGKW